MSAIRLFLARHPLSVQMTGWCVLLLAAVLDGYLSLPRPLSVPLSVYVALVGAPLVLAASFAASTPDASLPKSLRSFIRASPWLLGLLWFLAVCLVAVGIFETAVLR